MPPKKRLKPIPCQRTLSFAAAVTPDLPDAPVADEEDEGLGEEPRDNSCTQATPGPTASPPRENFQVGWLHTYRPWLVFENGLMFCKDCRALKLNNNLAQGTNNFRTNTLTRHILSADHKQTVSVDDERKNMQVAARRALTKEEDSVQIAMKAVYWLAQEN